MKVCKHTVHWQVFGTKMKKSIFVSLGDVIEKVANRSAHVYMLTWFTAAAAPRAVSWMNKHEAFTPNQYSPNI